MKMKRKMMMTTVCNHSIWKHAVNCSSTRITIMRAKLAWQIRTQVDSGHYWNDYRLGDGVKGYNPSGFNDNSDALTSPWHTPPKLLKAYRNKVQYPYDGADLFTVVRNPYSRVLSEYYCPFGMDFNLQFRRGVLHDMKDPNDPKVMNEWVKSMVRRLGNSLDEFNPRNHRKERVVRQAKGLNEDKMILAQKHYINQAECKYKMFVIQRLRSRSD